MANRNAVQRRKAILEWLDESGVVTVEQLSALLATSEVTIRKDLAALEAEGLLLRRRGGAVSVPQTPQPRPLASVLQQRIAAAAVACIKPQGRIIIDCGSTTAAMIPHLVRRSDLVVMTNSLAIAKALSELERPPTLLMSGGTWDPHSGSFQGRLAEQSLHSYDFDQLFIGADGIDGERGTTSFNELLRLSQVMAEVSRQVIVLAEADKWGRRIPNLELPWSRIDCLITDDRLSPSARSALAEQGVGLVCVPDKQED